MSGVLRDQQWALTRHLRDPAHHPAPDGLEAARLQVYRDLLFNNLQALLAGSFPVLLQILTTAEWDALCRRYFAEHRCTSPLFTEVAAEFVGWLQSAESLPRPFLAELAHYEWVEQALQGSDASPLPTAQGTDPWQVRLQVSPLAWPLAYQWPVQHLGRDHQPAHPPLQPSYLLARRTPEGHVVFSELSPLAWALLDRIIEGTPDAGRGHLHALAMAHGLEPQALEADGRALLAQMLAAGVIGPMDRAGAAALLEFGA
jgi:uncharacterized protein